MSEFVSFPRAGIEDNERNPSIYDKMFSAASHMFQSFREPDLSDTPHKPPPPSPISIASSNMSPVLKPISSAQLPSVKLNNSAIDSNSLKSRPVLHVETPKPLNQSIGVPPDGVKALASDSSGGNLAVLQPSESAIISNTHKNSLKSSTIASVCTPVTASSTAAVSSSAQPSPLLSSTTLPPAQQQLEYEKQQLQERQRQDQQRQGQHKQGQHKLEQRHKDRPYQPQNAEQPSGDTVSSQQSEHRPPLLRSSTTSSATVGLSAEQAVPHLPTANGGAPAAPTRSRSLSIDTQHSGSINSVADVESMFSVNSTSASRAYLASQYSRSRSRAAPGRLSREFWMKDESATSCFNCNRAFTTFRRKHHCRVCGQIFCSACTALIDGEVCGAPGRRVRCCKTCEDSLAQHSSSEDEGDMSFWSQAPQDEGKWPELLPTNEENPPYRDIVGAGSRSISYAGDVGIVLNPLDNSDKQSVRAGDENDGHVPTESYSRLASPVVPDEPMFARSFLGLGHHHQNWGRPRSHSQASRDDEASSNSPSLQVGAPSLSSYGSNSHLNMMHNHHHILGSSVYGSHGSSHHGVSAATPHSVVPYGHSNHNEDQHYFPSSNALFPNSATVELNNAAIKYLSLFLDQLLKDSELEPQQWASILMKPILELASGLHLEINDKISPREWVKIKRIPGGEPRDIDYINGIVFTHSLTRKSMPKRIVMPRILLITFPIEYARNERYVSLVPIVAQEREYLKKLVARITALKPTMLLTSSYVSGIAIGMLEAAGVAVAQNVRESALFRLSRITRADILVSIDRLSVAPQLGICECFEQRSYRYEDFVKTFLFFFVRPADPGRCALVRGDPEISSIIKVVLEVMAEICYSLKAETALMRDQFVTVPSLTEEPSIILSSSPFVDYGSPFLQKRTRELEDMVVDLGNKLDAETSKELRYVVTKNLECVRQKWMETSKIWEGIENAYPFMFNPSSHQNLIVLYSLVCAATATPCVGPDSQLIEFYLNTDQTLGKFVESNITQAEDTCPDGCNRPLSAHYKTYVNGNGMVTVVIEKLPCKVPGLEDSILMWSYCKMCEQQMPIVPMSSTTWKCSMGKYLELTFYGEPLRMRASSCPHNVYRDHIRYFGWHGYALRIEYSVVALNEITGPSRILRWKPEAEIKMKHDAYQEWLKKLKKFWGSLLDSLSQVKIEGLEDSMIELSQQKLKGLRAKATVDRDTSIAVLEKLYNETDPSDYLSLNKFLENYQQLVDQWHSDIADFDGQFFPTERDIRRVTAQHIRGLLGEDTGKPRFSRRSSATSIPATVSSRSEESGDERAEAHPPPIPYEYIQMNDDLRDQPLNPVEDKVLNKETSVEEIPIETFNPSSLAPTSASKYRNDGALSDSFDRNPASEMKKPIMNHSIDKIRQDTRAKSLNEGSLSGDRAMEDSAQPIPLPPHTPSRNRLFTAKSPSSSDSSKYGSPSSVRVKSRYGNDINLSMPGLTQSSLSDGGNRVAILAEHFEELSREFERERIREKTRLRERQRAIRQRHAHPVAEVFEDVTDAIEDWPQPPIPRNDDNDDKNTRVTGLRNDNPPKNALETSVASTGASNTLVSPKTTEAQKPAHPSNENRITDLIKDTSIINSAGIRDQTVKKAESAPESGNENEKIGPDLNKAVDDQAVAEPPQKDLGVPVIEPEEEAKRTEPSKLSLIHTLANFWAERSSTRWNGIEYVLQPKEHFFTNSSVVIRESEPSSLIAFCLSLPDYLSRIQDFYMSTAGSSNTGIPFERVLETEENNQILEKAMLRQTGTHMRYHFERNTVKVSCKIFYSEQFDALRRKCQVGDKFIQSLSRCNTWDSTGGKSGSAFLKTLDDRLILKELSHGEFDSFVNFAPSYFEYMSQALFHELPTVLSKIFGVYQITIRNTSTSQQVKMYVLVMENLFYGTTFSKVFDLKGSMRNRKVTETGRENEVLLDENMVEYIYESPVFVREQSKRMLRTSLYNDTLFLTKMNVMDYSLIIGLDEENSVIVAGIIDYIRTYTWDKKIESWVKTRAATSGFKEPTVVSPKQYKGRFRESMERYFVMVPDCWSQPGSF